MLRTDGDGYYLLYLWRERVEFSELKRVLVSLAEQWKPNAILVEDKASGQMAASPGTIAS
jgi:phage terminase large subunit-like protein